MRTKYKDYNLNHHTPTDITLTYIYVYIPGDWRLTSNQILLSHPDPAHHLMVSRVQPCKHGYTKLSLCLPLHLGHLAHRPSPVILKKHIIQAGARPDSRH